MSRRRQRRTDRRYLSMEVLEGRRLLVVGPIPLEVPPQNFANPEDSNNDGTISPADALVVINDLNQSQSSGSPTQFSTDVDGDGIVSPLDALLVINRLNSHSETSSVPPQQRAIGLRKALEAGVLPPRMSLSDAQELLETLENGGHYEAGDRYRNGQMLNLRQSPDNLEGTVAQAESEAANSELRVEVDSTTELAEPDMSPPRTLEETDPLALFDSAETTLGDPLHDPAVWRAFLDARVVRGTEVVDRLAARLSEQLAERLESTNARERIARAIEEAIEIGDTTADDILDEIAAIRATLGDAHSQVAQLFANVDIEGIVERLGVDLGTLAEAVLSHHRSDAPDQEPIITRFLSREYLHRLSEILP